MSETPNEPNEETEGEPATPPEPEPTPDEEEEEQEATQPPEGEPGPEAATQPDSFAESERINKAMESERKRHTTRVSSILEEAALEVAPCPLCGEEFQGFIWPGTASGISDESRVFAYQLLGMAPPSELREASGLIECPRCGGLGQLKRPSRVPGQETMVCPNCSGAGDVPDPEARGQGAQVTHLPPPIQPPAVGGGDYAMPDSWGRPPGHPHFGIAPAEVGA